MGFHVPLEQALQLLLTGIFRDKGIGREGELWAIETDYMFPDMAGDVSDFVEMITSHTADEMKAEMEGYETLLVKYNILIEAVKDACGVDLQAIGDNKPIE